uniref:Uncharacterized protein n=1 Tax=Pelusios castaneus TaxID=367368 RepID=A0A8C8RX06_9SAUR
MEETKCPICLEYLTDPVNTHCGHNFCQACITQYCEKWDEPVNGPLCCPNCRERIQKGALRNNYQLANIVEKIKHLDYRQGTENLCSVDTANVWGMTVTLDPDTAHPDLVLSEDGKRVRWDHTQQDLPNNPERFDTEPCVLGRAGFTSGRHCWEVEVGDGLYWAVGVARESVRRKGQISHSPEGGIWAVRRWEDQFEALTSPVTPLPQSRAPSRIRVCLDCDRGQVTFFGAGDEAPIFTFPLGSVPGERIRPWLRVEWWGSASHTLVSMALEDSCLHPSTLLVPPLCDTSNLPLLSAPPAMGEGGG